MAHPAPGKRLQRGQSTVEWVGLIALVSILFISAVAGLGAGFPGAALARQIAAKVVCAVEIGGDSCADPAAGDELELAYGSELAAVVRKMRPEIRYEFAEPQIPVDFRRCRDSGCAAAKLHGAVTRSRDGLPATSFVHAIDCRMPAHAVPPEADCSAAAAAGNLYLQYWLYYPDSYTKPFGEKGYHPDDWESYQVRIGPNGIEDRASSHASYYLGTNPRGWLADAGRWKGRGWSERDGYVWVSSGSHAGRTSSGSYLRWTPAADLRLVPIETAIYGFDRHDFAVSPAWRKDGYYDPEDDGTAGDRNPLPNLAR